METPPTNSYVDLQIIDCNRQHSVQARSGNNQNPALFTNELGEGIQLDVGDRVSVQGAYISEIGAGQDTIELKGKALGSEKTITYIKEDNKFPTTLSQPGIALITGFQELNSSEVPETFIPSDNETKITCEYYLNSNGDSGYMFMPRRFGWSSPDPAATGNDIKYWADNWLKNDSTSNGRAWFEQIDDSFNTDDFMYIDTSENNTLTTGFFRLKTDNSRYTLMRAVDKTFILRQETVAEDGTKTVNIPISKSIASHYKYKIFRNKVDIKVNAGFNSPENIGEEITSILKNAEPPTVFQQEIDGVIHDLTITYKTPTFKPFLCASSETMGEENWQQYAQKAVGDAISEDQYFFNYQSNFYNIYCKRPEIREAGQNVNFTPETNQGHNMWYDIAQADRLTSVIETKIPWEDAALFAPLFKAQGLYPELFSNNNAQKMQPYFNGTLNSVNNMRYLHMQNHNPGQLNTVIGGDNCFTPTTPTHNEQSLPVFFKYQPENADIETDGTSTSNLSYGFATKKTITLGDGTTKHYINIHPELIGGINNLLFTFRDNTISEYRALGFDLSFNSYGSAYMIGYNGRLPYDFGTANLWGIGNKNRKIQEDPPADPLISPLRATEVLLRQNYVGANNPRFGYDTEESRFFFKDLHTPELTGQTDYGAGDTGTIAEDSTAKTPGYVFPLDNTTNGNRAVYKLNKRINEYVYSPDMRPYDRSFITKYAFPAPNPTGTGGPYPDPTATPRDTARKISDMNRNITPWAIFDSPTGIFINDFGYTKEQFPNSLWGLLGWTYDSLQAPATGQNNRLQRVDNSNIENLSIPTTNSDIVSSDTRDFIVNQFGAVYFTTQIPTPSMVGADTTDGGQTRRRQYTPPISQGTVSIGLTAPNLPRKMLKPYYCIRSDIIDKPHYLGGTDNEAKLPVVAVADKQYSGNDFIFSSESDYVFTITKKKKITSITTSIHDPNQSFASVNDDSAVIYKISKNITNRLDIAQQVMSANQSEKK
tara:strand:- start:362 stop:3340 length:2979 start_codon:yes stop_codon:yes gene_type:complete